MTSHSDFTATDNNRATVAVTVAITDDSINDGAIATDTATNPDDAIYATGGKKVSSSYRQDAGIQTQGQQARGKALPSTANAGNDGSRQAIAVLGRLDSGVLPE